MESQMRQKSIESIENQLDNLSLTLTNGETLTGEIETLEEVFDRVKDDVNREVNSEPITNTISSVVDLANEVEYEIGEIKEMIEAIRVTLDELRS